MIRSAVTSPAFRLDNAAVILQRAGVELRRPAGAASPSIVRRRPALKGDVVDGDDRPDPARAAIGQIGRGKPACQSCACRMSGFQPSPAPRAQSRAATQDSAAKRCALSGPVAARPGIGPALAVIKMRRIQQQHRHARRPRPPAPAPARPTDPASSQTTGQSAALRPQARDRPAAAPASPSPVAASAAGQRAHHIGQPAGLDQRHAFRRHRQHPPDQLHAALPFSVLKYPAGVRGCETPGGSVASRLRTAPWPAHPACPA